jgi:N-acetylglutamate synthase-like GNAT family acetyltransferase
MELRPPATPYDFKKYYRLRYEVLRKPWHQPEGSEKAADDNQATHVMAVTGEHEVIGVCRMHLQTPHEAQLRFMAVHPDYEGQGIGAQMLDYLEAKAAAAGANLVTLQARENAVVFYKRNGYDLVEISHVLFGEIQHYKMQKKLQPASL